MSDIESLTVKSSVTFQEVLRRALSEGSYQILTAEDKAGINRIKEPMIHRPGLALAGYTEHFEYDRIQIFGRNEISYLESLEADVRKNNLKKMFELDIPGIIVTNDIDPPVYLKKICDKHKVPLVKIKDHTSVCIRTITDFLEEVLAPAVTMHGVCVEVYGVGVLILGKSSIGKSESALDLIERGHRLVSDDVVDILRMPGGTLIATGGQIIKYHMEIRGIGIINVRSLFGVSAIRERQRVDLVVDLELWDNEKEYDRLGMDDNWYEILGTKIPYILVPVRPGRNIAVIIEVAAMNQRLKMMGYHAAREFNKRLIDWVNNPDDLNRNFDLHY